MSVHVLMAWSLFAVLTARLLGDAFAADVSGNMMNK